MRFLSGLPNVVTSLSYKPRRTPTLTVYLVMELMEVRPRDILYHFFTGCVC